MALTYLSGDGGRGSGSTNTSTEARTGTSNNKTVTVTVNGKRTKYKMQVGKSAKAKKRQDDRKKKKAEKKAKGGRGKKVVKIALAPARGALLTLVTLNLFKLGTKLAKLWNTSAQAKADLQKMWVDKFKGDLGKLKEAISKGSKTSIAGTCEDQVGVATEVLLASAVPILLALKELFTRHKIPETTEDSIGDAIDDGTTELNKNPTNYGTVGPATAGPDGSKDTSDDGDDTTKGSFFSAWGMCWWGLMLTGQIQSNLSNTILLFISSVIATYFLFGFLFFGWIYQMDLKWKKYISWYFDYPANFIKNIFGYGKKIFSKA